MTAKTITTGNETSTKTQPTGRSNPKASARKRPSSKRFNLNLSAQAYEDMEYLAEATGGRTLTEVFRLALTLLKTIYPAIQQGQELRLVDVENNIQTRIIIPR
jgi:hypothetical protein